jgi:hypothetical protein
MKTPYYVAMALGVALALPAAAQQGGGQIDDRSGTSAPAGSLDEDRDRDQEAVREPSSKDADKKAKEKKAREKRMRKDRTGGHRAADDAPAGQPDRESNREGQSGDPKKDAGDSHDTAPTGDQDATPPGGR